jgi:O-antigen/teichoic acid export membrane protein
MASAALFTGLADVLADSGLGGALVQRQKLTDRDFGAVLTVGVLISWTLFAILLVAAPRLETLLDVPRFAIILCTLGLTVLLVPFRTLGMAWLERKLAFSTQSIIQVTTAVVQTVCVLLFALADYGVWALVGGVLVARVTCTVLLLILVKIPLRLMRPTFETARLVRFGWTIAASTVLWYIYVNADSTIIAVSLGPVSLGHYSVAFQLISIPVDKISGTMNQVTFVVYCKLRDQPDRLRHWFAHLLILRMAAAWPALAGLALVAEDAVQLILGEKWQPIVLPLRLLAPVGGMMIIGTAFPPLFNAIGRPDFALKYTMACIIALPISFFTLAKQFGIIGVCAAWLIVYPAIMCGMIHLSRHVTGMAIGSLLRMGAPILVGVVGMSVVMLWFDKELTGHMAPIGRILLVCCAGAVTYMACMLLIARHTIVKDVLILARELRSWRAPVRQAAPRAPGH